MESTLKIAIVSDLHFVDEAIITNNNRPSWLTLKSCGSITSSLWDDLRALVTRELLNADLLLCAGDITSFADPTGLKSAWRHLLELGSLLQSDLVASATGNHDVASRQKIYKSGLDAIEHPTDFFEHLKQLDPPYPVYLANPPNGHDSHRMRIHYFGADYIMVDEFSMFRLVVFNSCARHTSNSDDYERGRAANSALEWLRRDLMNTAKSDKINIFLCHHHPISYIQNDGREHDFMANGEKILRLLSEHGHWLIIHGHKHQGRIVYGSSATSRNPIVFAAGTLSAHTHLSQASRNQFYLLDVMYRKLQGLRGTLKVWNWTALSGFEAAESSSDGLFTGVGFGEKAIFELAANIRDFLTAQVFCDWLSVKQHNPRLNYLSPGDLDVLKEALNDVGVALENDENGRIVAVSLKEDTHNG